jgi:calcineurin-like phosphoesterase family protein
MKAQFGSIAKYRELKLDGRKVVLCHYPLESWNQMARGSWHLHGHSHGNLVEFGLRADVGVDCWSYAPVTYGELVRHMETRTISAYREAKAQALDDLTEAIARGDEPGQVKAVPRGT